MSRTPVSIHPYFKVHPGKLESFKALLPRFEETTRPDSKNLYYEFTLNGDVVFCREAYADAEAALQHCQSVGPLIEEALKVSDLMRLEIHGSEEDIERLRRSPLADLNPEWFVKLSGLER